MAAGPTNYTYRDVLNRPWPIAKLDALIADPEASQTIMAGASIGLRPNGTWNLQAVLNWARARYRREEVAVFAALLVTRYFHTDGARYLGRRSVR